MIIPSDAHMESQGLERAGDRVYVRWFSQVHGESRPAWLKRLASRDASKAEREGEKRKGMICIHIPRSETGAKEEKERRREKGRKNGVRAWHPEREADAEKRGESASSSCIV